MKNLFKFLTIAIFTVAILSNLSFESKESKRLIQGEPISKIEFKQSIEKYVFFRIYVRDNEKYYFSNIVVVEGNSGFDFGNNLDVEKNRFKKILKRDFNIDWTAPVQDYQDTNESALESLRKKTIGYAGDNWENIEL